MQDNMFERIQLKKMNEHVYLMDDAGQATGYLVIGNTKALVIDTMNGLEDVNAVVRSLTDLPVMVVNTHGHCDHIFGNIYFEEAYLHPSDLPIAEAHMQLEEFRKECEKHNMHMPQFRPIQGGDTIDLGNLHLDVIELPGHTPGGILLLLKEDRILFTGDGINHHLWMQLEESRPLDELANNLDAVMYLKNEADYILHGHARDFDDISLIQKMREGVREILEHKTEQDEPYNWFGGVGKIHKFDDGQSAICYRPGSGPGDGSVAHSVAHFKYITLRENPELRDAAASWFHSKWGVPKEAYLDCMNAYLDGETEYGWYLCLCDGEIVGGMGVIDNDFHDRKDLSPNVCAVYTEEDYRGRGIAGKLLSTVVADMKEKGISPIYLITNHIGFYERYGWEFLCMVQGDGEPEMTRMYIHR